MIKRVWLIAVGIVVSTWAVWFSMADELVIEDLPGRPTIPFAITQHVKLARDWDPFSRGSLRLACTTTGELRLVLQMRSPYSRERTELGPLSAQDLEVWLNVPGEIKMPVGIVGKSHHSLPNRKAYIASIRSSLDTIVFEPLSLEEVEDLAAWLDETWLERFSFGYYEYMVSMHGFSSGNSVTTLAHQCVARS